MIRQSITIVYILGLFFSETQAYSSSTLPALTEAAPTDITAEIVEEPEKPSFETCALYLTKLNLVDQKEAAVRSKDIQAAFKELEAIGGPMENEIIAQIDSIIQLNPLFELSIGQRALAAELESRGFKKAEDARAYILAFKLLDMSEQLAIVDGIFSRIEHVLPRKITSDNIVNIRKIAKSVNMEIEDFLEVVKNWQRLATYSEQEVKLVILSKLLDKDKFFVSESTKQFSAWSKFRRWLRSDPLFYQTKYEDLNLEGIRVPDDRMIERVTLGRTPSETKITMERIPLGQTPTAEPKTIEPPSQVDMSVIRAIIQNLYGREIAEQIAGFEQLMLNHSKKFNRIEFLEMAYWAIRVGASHQLHRAPNPHGMMSIAERYEEKSDAASLVELKLYQLVIGFLNRDHQLTEEDISKLKVRMIENSNLWKSPEIRTQLIEFIHSIDSKLEPAIIENEVGPSKIRLLPNTHTYD